MIYFKGLAGRNSKSFLLLKIDESCIVYSSVENNSCYPKCEHQGWLLKCGGLGMLGVVLGWFWIILLDNKFYPSLY